MRMDVPSGMPRLGDMQHMVFAADNDYNLRYFGVIREEKNSHKNFGLVRWLGFFLSFFPLRFLWILVCLIPTPRS